MTTTASATLPKSDPMTREVTLTRMIDAPRALVWAAWTEPKRMAQWWGPHHFTNPVCEMDVRAGRQMADPHEGAGRHGLSDDRDLHRGGQAAAAAVHGLRRGARRHQIPGIRHAGDLRGGGRPDQADGEGERQGTAPGRAADAGRHGCGLERRAWRSSKRSWWRWRSRPQRSAAAHDIVPDRRGARRERRVPALLAQFAASTIRTGSMISGGIVSPRR